MERPPARVMALARKTKTEYYRISVVFISHCKKQVNLHFRCTSFGFSKCCQNSITEHLKHFNIKVEPRVTLHGFYIFHLWIVCSVKAADN